MFVGMHRFLFLFFCSRQPIKIQKQRFKNGGSQQTFGHSYFVRDLVVMQSIYILVIDNKSIDKWSFSTNTLIH